MRRIIFCLVLLAVLLVGSLVLAAPWQPVVAQTNLVFNEGFEGGLTGWTHTGSTAVVAPPYLGLYSAVIPDTSSTIYQGRYPLNPGWVYDLEGEITAANCTGELWVRIYNSLGSPVRDLYALGPSDLPVTNNFPNWLPAWHQFRADQDERWVEIWMNVSSPLAAPYWAQFDQVSLGPNVNTDIGFESGSDWVFNGSASRAFDPHGGFLSALVPNLGMSIEQTVSLNATGAELYKFSAYISADINSSASIEIITRDSNGNPVLPYNWWVTNTAPNYNHVYGAIRVDGTIEKTATIRLSLLSRSGAPGWGQFDDIELAKSRKSPCFIATAAYGSFLDPRLDIFREFRDQYLMPNPVGEELVRLYYSYSPPAADFIARHDSLRAVVRVGLLPLLGVSAFFVWTTLWQKLATLVFLAVALAALAVLIRRRTRRARDTPV